MTDDFDIFSGGSWTDQPPPDDEFRIRTVDTGAFEAVQAKEATATDADQTAVAADDFTAITVEPAPAVTARWRSPAPTMFPRRAIPRQAVRSRHQRETGKPSLWFSTLFALLAASFAAVLVATIFSLWTRPTFFSDEFRAGLNQVQATQRLINIQPSPLPTDVREVRIGIIAGHSGPPQDPAFAVDPGAVCDDGLTELEINDAVARRVVTALQRDSYTVELLYEFDPRLENYQADVLVSIHTNDCRDYGAAGTGYNVASASARQTTHGEDERLLDCLVAQYGATTGLPRHFGITTDMTEYHTFSEVAVDTPTAIIEIGYMRNDRTILTQNPDLLAQGIANGIRCFLRPELYGKPADASQ